MLTFRKNSWKLIQILAMKSSSFVKERNSTSKFQQQQVRHSLYMYSLLRRFHLIMEAIVEHITSYKQGEIDRQNLLFGENLFSLFALQGRNTGQKRKIIFKYGVARMIKTGIKESKGIKGIFTGPENFFESVFYPSHFLYFWGVGVQGLTKQRTGSRQIIQIS